jgi:hypothetical protein
MLSNQGNFEKTRIDLDEKKALEEENVEMREGVFAIIFSKKKQNLYSKKKQIIGGYFGGIHTQKVPIIKISIWLMTAQTHTLCALIERLCFCLLLFVLAIHEPLVHVCRRTIFEMSLC